MNEKMTALKRVDVMIAIRKEAEQDLVNLRRLCGKAIWEDNTELSYMGQFGYEGNVGARTYRALVPLRLAVHVFEKADVDIPLNMELSDAAWRNFRRYRVYVRRQPRPGEESGLIGCKWE